MKRLVIALAVTLLTLTPSLSATVFPVEKVARSVVQLWSPELDESLCSASALGSDYFGTAGHCILNAPESGYTVFNIPVTAVEVDEENDIAVVRATAHIKIEPIALGPEPKRGDEVMTFGFLGVRQQITFFPGVVQARSDPQAYDHMVLAGHSGSGMSGGPVVDTKGRLVAVHQAWADPTMTNQRGTLTLVSNYLAMKSMFEKYTK